MKRITYLLSEAIRGLRANRTSTVIGILTTAFTMASFGVFLLLFHNVQTLVGTLHDHVDVVIYLTESVSPDERRHLETLLKGESRLQTLTVVSKEQALQEFHEEFPNERYLLEGIETNPFPASLVATFASDLGAHDTIAPVVAELEEQPGVERIRYSQDWVEHLTLVVSYLKIGAIVIGAILALASVTIIANTIRLAIFVRREEIEILRLIGATGTFIAIPYLVEGAVLGALGGALSIGVLRAGFELLKDKLQDVGLVGNFHTALAFFPLPMSLSLVLAGLVLGCTASALSVYGWMRVRS